MYIGLIGLIGLNCNVFQLQLQGSRIDAGFRLWFTVFTEPEVGLSSPPRVKESVKKQMVKKQWRTENTGT